MRAAWFCIEFRLQRLGVRQEGIDLAGQFQEFIGLPVEFLNFRSVHYLRTIARKQRI
jgi:hypothetical protein